MKQREKPAVRVRTRKIERALARKKTPAGKAMAKELALRKVARQQQEAAWRATTAPRRRPGEGREAFRRRVWRWEQKVNRPQRFGGGSPRPDVGIGFAPRQRAAPTAATKQTKRSLASFLRKLNLFQRRRTTTPRRLEP